MSQVIRWLEGTLQLDPANAGDQSSLRRSFSDEIPDMSASDLDWTADALIKKGSAFVAALLHRYPDLTFKQKIAALNSLAKRRNTNAAEFRRAPVKLEYKVLMRLSHKRRLKIMKIFMNNKNEIAMTDEELNQLLFLYINTDNAWVDGLKKTMVRAEKLKKWPKEKLAEMYLSYKVQELIDDVNHNRTEKIKKMLWDSPPRSIEYLSEDDLFDRCTKLGLIK
jgi:hypothetical protein